MLGGGGHGRELDPAIDQEGMVVKGDGVIAERLGQLGGGQEGPNGVRIARRRQRLEVEADAIAALRRMGIETIPGEHPIVPLMVRDTQRTRDLVRHLFGHGVLVTGLTYPVVPKGDEEIRTQVNADHTEADIDYVLTQLESFA